MRRSVPALLSALVAAACPQTNPDAGTSADSGTLSDAGISDAGVRDAAHPVDASAPPGDGSVTGSPLDDVTLEWPQPLALCNVWREGRPLADELAVKVVVTLPVNPRAGLQRSELEAARISGVAVLRSMYTSGRFRPADADIVTTVRRHEVSQTAAGTRLFAQVAHVLGDPGVLVEQYDLTRGANDPAPVTHRGGAFDEVTYWLERPDLSEVTQLAACQGAGELEDAISVLHASGDGGRSMVLTRYWRTRLAPAGSYPVYWTATTVVFPDEYWLAYESHEPLAQIYSAAHHNWVEDSVVDFAQEPAAFHVALRPIEEGTSGLASALERIELDDVQGVGVDSRARARWIRDDGGIREETFAVNGEWVRVDDTELTRTARQWCADASVFAVGAEWSGATFQLLTCPRAEQPGYTLKAVMPVAFSGNPSRVGVLVGESDIAEVNRGGRAGHTVDFGTHLVHLTRSDPQTYWTEIYRTGVADPETAFITEPRELGADPGPRDDTVRASNDGGVALEIKRRWAALGVGESVIYAPLSFSLAFGGTTLFVDGMDGLRYTNTHHNWNDGLEARAGSLTATWVYDFLDPPGHLVSVRDADGSVVLAPTELNEL